MKSLSNDFFRCTGV